MKKKYTEIRICNELFYTDIYVIFSKDIQRVIKRMSKLYDVDDRDFDCRGKIFYRTGCCPMIWMPKIPSNIIEEGTLSHELLHAAFKIGKYIGIYPNEETEEFFTHLHTYLLRQCKEKIKKRNLRNKK